MSMITKQDKVEKKKPYEDPRWVHYRKLFEPRFETYERDYLVRVYNYAKQYDKLKGFQQKFIQGALEDGFHYRGEPFEVFQKFYQEWEKMKAMSLKERAAYRKSFYGFVENIKQDIENESFKQQEKLYGESNG